VLSGATPGARLFRDIPPPLAVPEAPAGCLVPFCPAAG
jgi:hypothetical protein